MKKNYRNLCITALSTAAIFVGCNSNPQWQVKGTIDGGEGKLVVLEASNNGMWYMLDTLTLSSNGQFKFQQPAAGYPDIYRITVDGNSVYFPIDSIETVTVTSSAENFSGASRIEGSPQADTFMKVEAMIAEALKAKGQASAIVNDSDLKHKLADIILADPSSVASYYIINKKIGAVPLYTTSNKSDLRIIGAVANAFDVMRPNDPRTAYLKRLYLSNRTPSANTAFATDTLVANEVQIIDIELLDPSGKPVKLSDVTSKGNVVVLNFTSLTAKESPAFNLELGKIYEAYHNKGMEVYQISVDNDEFAWRQAAKNLPWISVYNNPNDMTALLKYNVGSLPVSFIIDRSGTLAERVTNISELGPTLNKYM